MQPASSAVLENRTFDELSIGDTASLTRTVTPDDVQLFAGVSGDINPAHLDPEFAAQGPFHHIIVHGLWGAGLISAVLGVQLPGPGTIYLDQSLKFLHPVEIGDTITAAVVVKEKRPEHRIVVLDCSCTNQHGVCVIAGEALVKAPARKVQLQRPVLPQVELVAHAAAPAAPGALAGKRGLVVGVANQASIAYGCARAFRAAGAELAITYLNDKAEPFVRPLAEGLGAALVLPCDVRQAGALEAVFDQVRGAWGGLDFLLHAIAFAPKDDLHGRLADSSADGFATAMDISCHSFVRMARLAEPLMLNGGCLLTTSYYGSERVVEHYDLMGPVKAALESCVRYLAAELGPRQVRVNAISPGPIRTRAASGLERFDELVAHAQAQAPEHRLAGIEDVGALAAFLVGEGASRITGAVIPVDAGQHLIA